MVQHVAGLERVTYCLGKGRRRLHECGRSVLACESDADCQETRLQRNARICTPEVYICFTRITEANWIQFIVTACMRPK